MLITISFVVFLCRHNTDYPDDVKISLRLAGNNATELEKVLAHYRDDSLKFRAACFLIANMPNHYFMSGKSIDEYRRLVTDKEKPVNFKKLDKVWAEATEKYGEDVVKVYDIHSVSANYLIDNIDDAFDAWRLVPWNKDVSFEIFCRYILPYRFTEEQLTIGWRKKLRKIYLKEIAGINDMYEAFGRIAFILNKELQSASHTCPYVLDAITLNTIKRGPCIDRCIVRGSVMRALGFPVAYDYTKGFANYSSTFHHGWIALVGKGGKPYTVYEEDSVARYLNWIDATYFKPRISVPPDFPYTIDSLKRVAKVFRKNFDLSGIHADDEDKSVLYGLIDSVVIKTEKKNDILYLCTYRTGEGWTPVTSEKSFAGKCVFHNIGNHIVYLAMRKENDNYVPEEAPFILLKGGIRKSIIPSKDVEVVKLNRKYVLMTNVINRWADLIGGRIEGSNDKNFKNKTVLYEITKMPHYRNTISISNSRKFRYVRFVSSGVPKTTIAELAFFNKGQKLDAAKKFGYNIKKGGMNRAFDNDLMSIADSQKPDFWIALDFESQKRIDEIEFFPRNDDNFIRKGEMYTLYYWNVDKWRQVGQQKGMEDGGNLIFENVPVGALLILKNETNGNEERIFTYEKGKQMWW